MACLFHWIGRLPYLLIAAAAVPGAAMAQSGARVMVVGDSISQGLEGDFTWRYRLSQHFSRHDVNVDFVGPWTGTTSLPDALPDDFPEEPTRPVRDGRYRPGIRFDSDHLSQWGWQMHQAKDVIGKHVQAHRPDYLLVELGFNDLGWGVNSPAGVIRDLRALVRNAREAQPDLRVLVANVPHRTPIEELPKLPGLISRYNRLLPAAVRAMSTRRSPVVLVDLDGPYDEDAHAYDGLHPDVRGEYVIARAFADVLSEQFDLGPRHGAIPDQVPPRLRLRAPARVKAVVVGDTVRLSWGHVFGAAGYWLYTRDVTARGKWKRAPLPIPADGWTERILPAGHRIELQVRAMRGEEWESPPSRTVAARLPGLPAVANLKLRPGVHAVTLSWSPVDRADDYHVYAAPGCDLLPPSADQYVLVQFALRKKTTWKHEFITHTCMNYYVVASRFGGEGERPTFGERVLPYLHNWDHAVARERFFEDPPQKGDRIIRTRVAGGRDRGIVVVRAFIRNKDWISDVIGDHRQWSPVATASSKIAVAWDTGTGEVAVYVQKSCAVGATLPGGPVQTMCRGAVPVELHPDAASIEDPARSTSYVTIARSGTGLSIGWSAVNSWNAKRVCSGARCLQLSLVGRINARIILGAAGSGVSARLIADRFPAYEIVRYPHYVQGHPEGLQKVVGTRDQRSIRDLDAGKPKSRCVSRPPEKDAQPTHPMRC